LVSRQLPAMFAVPSVTEEDYSWERRICYGSQPFA